MRAVFCAILPTDERIKLFDLNESQAKDFASGQVCFDRYQLAYVSFQASL